MVSIALEKYRKKQVKASRKIDNFILHNRATEKLKELEGRSTKNLKFDVILAEEDAGEST